MTLLGAYYTMSPMLEEGEVVKVEGKRVVISLPASSHCERCGICGSGADSRRTLEVTKKEKLSVGDKVEIYIPEGIICRVGFLLFILPLLGFIGGYGVLWLLIGSEVIAATGGGVVFFLVLYAIWLYGRKIKEIEKITVHLKEKNGSADS